MSRRHWLAAGAFGVLAGPLSAQGTRVGGPPEIVSAAAIDPAREINFASGVWPSRLYVGQQATYQIGIFLGEGMRSRLRTNPQFVPPDVRSMIAYDLPVPSRLFARREGGRDYDVHVFARALFPITPGQQRITPARLTYSVPLSNSIFSREESHSARSAAHTIMVLQPPDSGRPAGYQGAVGRLSVRARLDATETRVGDPVLLTLTVSGVGNVGLFPRPALALPWGHAVAGSERVRVDSTAALIAGDKEFEWVVTPREAGAQAVPGIRYPYFNPYTERYEVAVTQPLGIAVRPGTLVSPAIARSDDEPTLRIRRALRGDVGPDWPARPLFWMGVMLAPLPVLARRWRARPRAVDRTSPRRELEALARGAIPPPGEVRRLARAVLLERVPSLRTQAPEAAGLERGLRRAGVSVTTAAEARRVFGLLDEVAWGGTRTRAGDLTAQVVAVLDAIDREATPPGPPPPARAARRSVPVLLLAAGAGTLGAAAGDRDAAAFSAAVAAYDAGNMQFARGAFFEIAVRRPRSADTWANLGTASWHAGDTASAVVGWQRALRLEPLAADVRTRLVATPSFRDGLVGDVPPVPVNAAASLGLLLWCAGWALAAWPAALARRSRLAVTCLAGAVVTATGTLWLAERLRGERQVVVVAPERLRDAPAVSARPGANVMAAETGTLLASQGVWSRVRFSDQREGWIDGRRLQSLEVPPAR